jgi:hypothetical protein
VVVRGEWGSEKKDELSTGVFVSTFYK